VIRLAPRPWWTEADAAELDLLTGEFVRAAAAHRERCDICQRPRLVRLDR
jgi:hypothetical protein